MPPSNSRRYWLWLGMIMVATLVTLAISAPYLAPYDPVQPAVEHFGEPQPPQFPYLCGTDELGRDVCSRLLYAARLSLLIAFCATTLAVGLGTTIGLCAGYAGGWIDAVLMRLTDSVLSFPVLLLAIALAALFEPGLTSLLLVIALVGWTGIARTVRGEVLSIRERDFIEAAHAMGAEPLRIIIRHLLPSVWPTVLVLAALNTTSALLLDAGLSFLGLGIPPPTPSWGRMLSESKDYYRVAPWLMFFPGFAIAFAVTGFNLLGHGLPASRQRR